MTTAADEPGRNDPLTATERALAGWFSRPMGPVEHRWWATAIVVGALLTPVAGSPGWLLVVLLSVLTRAGFEVAEGRRRAGSPGR